MILRKILVTGANGQVGKELKKLSSQYPDFDFLFLTREDLAIHHFDLVRRFFESYKPDLCINCAAYTAVDKAESEPELAYLINTESVGVLAAVCKAHECRFLHISTDYVFNGRSAVPYLESQETDPLNVYGMSKRAGEIEAIKYNADCVIVRTSWVYSVFGKNFVKTMARLMREKTSINVVSDQIGSPTHARDLAACLIQIAQANTWVPGIFHFSNEGQISWFEFAQAIRRITRSNCMVHPVATSDYPTPAKRPLFTVMDKTKIQATYGIQLVPWKDSLEDCLLLLEQEA